ncbi:MAG TPA: hypothetical protein VJO34_11275 [Methylomirabilota bacterium]|nr:hypothetical protein [Methylomirabilota bacterium]
MMEQLEKLVRDPLSLIERFHTEVQKMFEERESIQDLEERINRLREEIFQEGENQVARLFKEVDAVEQELLRSLNEIRELRKRAQVVRALVASLFRGREAEIV